MPKFLPMGRRLALLIILGIGIAGFSSGSARAQAQFPPSVSAQDQFYIRTLPGRELNWETDSQHMIWKRFGEHLDAKLGQPPEPEESTLIFKDMPDPRYNPPETQTPANILLQLQEQNATPARP
jgi:hypothetical protein